MSSASGAKNFSLQFGQLAWPNVTSGVFSNIGVRSRQVRSSFNSGHWHAGSAGPFDARQVTMGAVYRLAMRKDASRLHDIRRRSILELAPPTMPKAEAQAWASQLTLSGMEQKLRELEVWVAELDGGVVGWGAIHGDRLEGLYVAAEFAGQGVGAWLLEMLEGLMRERGIQAVQAEASSNAQEFYLRRGYRAAGPQTPKGAWPIAKELA
jgi:putative acetyltransferase